MSINLSDIIKQDNTRVKKPLIIPKIKRVSKEYTLVNPYTGVKITINPKNEEIRQDNRSSKLRKQDLKYSEQKSKLILLAKAEQQTLQTIGNIGDIASLSHIIGTVKSNKPLFESFTDPTVKASNKDLINFGIDMLSPGKIFKGVSTAAILTMPIRGLSKTKFGTHVIEEGGKRLIAERVHPEWFSGISSELLKEAEDFLKIGIRTRPKLWKEVHDNPELLQLVKDIADGKNQEILARFNDTGVAPNLGSIVALALTHLPLNKHVVIGMKGHLPIIGEWHNTKNMGNFNYFAGGNNAKWASAQYADIGTEKWADELLTNRGFSRGSQQYNYAMELFKQINELQRLKGVKRYAYKEGAKDRSGNAKNFSWEHLITKGPTKKPISWTEDEINEYLESLINWSDFWGGDLESGGLRQVIARADNPLGFALIEAEGRGYKDLSGSPIWVPRVVPTKIDANTDANKLGKLLERLRQPLFKISVIDDPIRIDTYGAYGLPDISSWFFQHKKGGKLCKYQKKCGGNV